jgi:hypothetical protein
MESWFCYTYSGGSIMFGIMQFERLRRILLHCFNGERREWSKGKGGMKGRSDSLLNFGGPLRYFTTET